MRKTSKLIFVTSATVGLALLTSGIVVMGAKAPEHKTWAAAQAANDQSSGTIAGEIAFQGTPPKRGTLNMDADPVCAARHTEAVLAEDGAVNTNGTLPNAFIYLKDVPGTFNPGQAAVLDQRGCMFRPHVLGVMVGQELKIVSSDATTHNINIVSQKNGNWDHSQLPGSDNLVRKFMNPEIMIPVICNMHPWMKGYIGVTSNPFYAVTGEDGAFTIKGVPPGTYTLATWTATFGTQEQKITVRNGETARISVTFKDR